MSIRGRFAQEMKHHWKVVGRSWQADKDSDVFDKIVEEWFNRIIHYPFIENDIPELFRRFRLEYSTNNSLTSLKCFIDTANRFRSEKRLAEQRKKEMGRRAGDEDDKADNDLNRVLSSFVLVWMSKLKNTKISNQEEAEKAMLKEALIWAREQNKPQEQINAIMKRMAALNIEIPEP